MLGLTSIYNLVGLQLRWQRTMLSQAQPEQDMSFTALLMVLPDQACVATVILKRSNYQLGPRWTC